MQAQTYQQESMDRPSGGWKTSALYAVLGVTFLAAVAAYGYSNGYLKPALGKVSDFFAMNIPSMAKTAGIEDSLTKARGAFESGNVNGAIDAYRQIVAANPKDIGAHGEMGNVLYAAGMRNEAAQSYFEAATLAIEKGQLDVAEALVPAIAEANPMLASQLDEKLYDAQMRADMARQPQQEPMQQQAMQQQPAQQAMQQPMMQQPMQQQPMQSQMQYQQMQPQMQYQPMQQQAPHKS